MTSSFSTVSFDVQSFLISWGSQLSAVSFISWMTGELFWKFLPLTIWWNVFSSFSSNSFSRCSFYIKVYEGHVAFVFHVSCGFWIEICAFGFINILLDMFAMWKIDWIVIGLRCHFFFSGELKSISVDHMFGTPCPILTYVFKSKILYMNTIIANS